MQDLNIGYKEVEIGDNGDVYKLYKPTLRYAIEMEVNGQNLTFGEVISECSDIPMNVLELCPLDFLTSCFDWIVSKDESHNTPSTGTVNSYKDVYIELVLLGFKDCLDFRIDFIEYIFNYLEQKDGKTK